MVNRLLYEKNKEDEQTQYSLFSYRLLKAVCHAFDWVIMTIQKIGNLNG